MREAALDCPNRPAELLCGQLAGKPFEMAEHDWLAELFGKAEELFVHLGPGGIFGWRLVDSGSRPRFAGAVFVPSSSGCGGSYPGCGAKRHTVKPACEGARASD